MKHEAVILRPEYFKETIPGVYGVKWEEIGRCSGQTSQEQIEDAKRQGFSAPVLVEAKRWPK